MTVRGPVSETYKTKGKITDLEVYIFRRIKYQFWLGSVTGTETFIVLTSTWSHRP